MSPELVLVLEACASFEFSSKSVLTLQRASENQLILYYSFVRKGKIPKGEKGKMRLNIFSCNMDSAIYL